MENYSAVLKLLLLISWYLSSADTHTLQYLYTAVTPELTDFPEFIAVGLLDGEQFMSYSSNKSLIIKDWIKTINSDTYWRRETEEKRGKQHIFINTFTTIMKEFHHNEGEGVHTLQRMFGCERDDDDVTTRRYDQCGYDGEDFISLNLTTGTWTVVKPQAVTIKHTWESKGSNKHWKNFLERDCIHRLKTYTSYSRDTLNRKVCPEVSVFHRHSSPSPEVVCHTTGFFPKPLNITWQKDREDVHEDVELRETLPNQDGSFQKRSILKVSRMKLWIHNYTCMVQHSSLEKELVREVPKGGGSDGAPIAIITAVVVALVTVVIGIVVWKKKNSGERTTGAAPEGDSSFNNSNTVCETSC